MPIIILWGTQDTLLNELPPIPRITGYSTMEYGAGDHPWHQHGAGHTATWANIDARTGWSALHHLAKQMTVPLRAYSLAGEPAHLVSFWDSATVHVLYFVEDQPPSVAAQLRKMGVERDFSATYSMEALHAVDVEGRADLVWALGIRATVQDVDGPEAVKSGFYDSDILLLGITEDAL